MAKKQENKEQSFEDDDARVRYVKEQTSSNAAFSTYERVSTPNPLDADLVLEHRGEPKEG